MSEPELRVLSALSSYRSIDDGNFSILQRGKFANAVVYRFRQRGIDWVIKDYSQCPAPLRLTLGRLFIGREVKALERLQGIDGVSSCHRRLGPYTLTYPFVEGDSLKDLARSGESVSEEFFSHLEKLVTQMHRRGVAHLDLRNMGNILRTRDGRPHLIDFQSALTMKYLPRRIRAVMRGADLSGIYKSWSRLCQQPVPNLKRRFFDNFGSLRRLWLFKGYPKLGFTGRKIKVISSGLTVAYILGVYLLMR